MTPGSLSPAFIQAEYDSAYGHHVMTLPVNTLDLDIESPENTLVLTWAGGSINWRDMLDALVGSMLEQFPATVVFGVATLWRQPTAEDLPIFVDSYNVDQTGTDASPGEAKATQMTITARDSNGAIAKLVLLDFASNNIWAKFTTVAGAAVAALWTEWTDPSNGWSSRKNARPNTFIAATRTLNEKLRRAYRLT